jgi:hypothetical protein
MDLFPAEIETLKKIVQEWHVHPERELETTFGVDGKVDTTTFMNVIKRLKAKGYEPLPQEDKLNILTPSGVRFTIYGMGVIQQYCKDDSLAGKDFIAIIKDKSTGDNSLPLDDYDVKIKVRREIPVDTKDPQKMDPQVTEILSRWTQQRKAFRMIRRWTFRGKGIRFDLSMVRSTPRDLRGNYRWTNGFNQEPKFLDQPPVYEIEVEVVREDGVGPEDAQKNLIRGIGEVLRGIQKSVLLTRKSVRAKIIAEYQALAGTPKFRGVAPRTLQIMNMAAEKEPNVPNIREGYNVTDKADGLRVMAFCNDKGDLWMVDMGMNIYRTGLRREACANTLLDGEWVTQDSSNKPMNALLLFDCYIGVGGKKVTQIPFVFDEPEKSTEGRHAQMLAWIDAWSKGDGPQKRVSSLTSATMLNVSKKEFYFGKAGNKSIFDAAKACISKNRVYHTDGLIFTENLSVIPEMAGVTFDKQFKWKPSEENTIDFMVVSEKDPDNEKVDKITYSVKPDTGETVRYKTLRLFVGSTRDAAAEDPRTVVLNELPLPGAAPRQRGRPEYKPTIFVPKNYYDTMASVCYREVLTDPDVNEEFIACERSGEPIQDKSIVEMRYEPANEPGWRWVPIRVRFDKTERLQRGIMEKTFNSEKVANDNWNSINDPVTLSMITNGTEEPTKEEIAGLLKAAEGREDVERKYYDRKGTRDSLLSVRGMIDFHNKWIKDKILIDKTLRPDEGSEIRKTLLDVACGKGGDLQKWRRARAGFVLGVDYAGENIRDPNDGAYARLISTWERNGKDNTPEMLFCIGDSGKQLVSGQAGGTPEDQRILRAIFGQMPPGGDIPSYADRIGSGRLKMGADVVACMFALHYFFTTKEIFSGFLENIRTTLKVGGYFIGCCFDGQEVFDLLRGVERGGAKGGKDKDGSDIWTIRKQYDSDELTNDDSSFGMRIDVNFISIGAPHPEYLMPFKLLEEKMKSVGCRLLTDTEASELDLNKSTNLFRESYEMAKKNRQNFPMEDAVKQFSFLNRWFIFFRESEGLGEEGEESVAPVRLAVQKEEAKVEQEELEVAAASAAKQGKPAATATLGVAASAVRPGTSIAEAVTNARVDGAERTVAVAASRAAPGSEVAAAKKTYTAGEVFQFFHNAALKDTLGVGMKGAGRWLSPNAPFRIIDPEKPTAEYPTMEHFLAGMKVKLASNNPDLAETIFGREGSIHKQFLTIRIAETGGYKRPLDEDRDYELLAEEREKVLSESKPNSIAKYSKTVYDEAKWATLKDKLLREAITQRYTKDAKFIKIVNAAREKGKYLLFYSQAVNDLGGKRKEDGSIEGQNKLGRFIMEIAGFA